MAKIRPMLTCLAFLLACCIHSTTGDGDGDKRLVVQAYYGKVQGRVRQADNGALVNEFLGIPYAAPPVGDLRFKNTVRVKKYNETIEADKMPPACPQYSEQPLPWYDLDPGQSEDCLYLNIWAPANVGKKKRPVKIYVHGGGWFDAGSNRMPYYDGFGQAVDTKNEKGKSKQDGIVVVTINYRLGALGFLSDSSNDAVGDMAYWDIMEAFDWTQKNIPHFGGDGGAINSDNFMTVEGHGTGAFLVSLMRTLSPQPFRMILNGASLFTMESVDGVDGRGDARKNNWRLTDLLAQELGCGSLNNSKNAIACLRGVEASRLTRVAASLSRGRGPPNVFLPEYIYKTNEPIQKHLYYTLQQDYTKTFYKNAFDTLATFTRDDGSALLTTAFPRVFGAFGEKDVPLPGWTANREQPDL